MSENKNVSKNVPEEVTKVTTTEQSAVKIVPTPISVSYVLEKIEQIAEDRDYIHKALEQLALMPKSDPGDIAGQEKAKAIGDIVRCRETTNQRLIALYEKLYDDLMEKDHSSKDKAFRLLEKANNDINAIALLTDALDTIRHLT